MLLDLNRHVTWNSQSECFISAQLGYATLKFVYDIGSRSVKCARSQATTVILKTSYNLLCRLLSAKVQRRRRGVLGQRAAGQKGQK